MASNFLENVKMYLFSQAVSRHCMIYFVYSPIKGFRFLEKIIHKNSEIKNLILLFLFHWLYFDILEKKDKNRGSPD